MHPEELDFLDISLLGLPLIRIAALQVDTLDIAPWLREEESPLSEHRRHHILQYLQQADRKCSLGATLIVNHLLQPLGLEEKDMVYGEGADHKPYFRNHPELHFNISHAGKYAIAALAPFAVGIDIQDLIDYQEDLARLCMQEEEWAEFQTYPDASRSSLFTKSWCAKEAILKAAGTGMMAESFPQLAYSYGRPHLADPRYKDYQLHTFNIENYAGAVAFK